MKKKICVVTGTRAEYGLLRPLMEKIRQDEDLVLQLVATGMHLSPEFGLTYRQIEEDGFCIDEKVEMLLSADTKSSIVKSTGLGMIGFSDALCRLSPDMLIVLGDRYEIFAAATVAMMLNIPIAHIHGGESTEGLVDEAIRHAITKMSYLHFVSTKPYQHRIIQLGESPERVFDVGALGVENIKHINLMSKSELEESIGYSITDRTAMVTFHPVTLKNDDSKRQMRELLRALEYFDDMKYIFTKSNADADGRIINRMIDEFVDASNGRHIAFVSLGQVRYLSALGQVCMVIGNSSSGIIEVPSFRIPTVNIGERQRGRIQAKSVINCDSQRESIIHAIAQARDSLFLESIKNVVNPYEKEETSQKIANSIKEFLLEKKIDLKKYFYDL